MESAAIGNQPAHLRRELIGNAFDEEKKDSFGRNALHSHVAVVPVAGITRLTIALPQQFGGI